MFYKDTIFLIEARRKCGAFTFIGHKTFARVYNMIHDDLDRRPKITIYAPSIFLKALKLSWRRFIFIFNTMLELKNACPKDFLQVKGAQFFLIILGGGGWGGGG